MAGHRPKYIFTLCPSCQRYQLHRRDPNDMVNLARNPTQTLVSLSGVNIFCGQGGNAAIHRTVAQIS